jgi:hypothetical protein
MRNTLYKILLALFAAALPACFYSDEDMYLVEPVPGDPPVLTVSTSLDTLVDPLVGDSLEVSYLAEVSNGEFYYVYADVAGSTIYESDSAQGVFWITPFMADSSGIDTLYMDFYYSTNSNSLADLLAYEAQFQSLTFAIDFSIGGGQ